MNKNLSKTLFLCLQLTIFSSLLLFPTIKSATAQPPSVWWNERWRSVTPVNLTETLGKERISEPVDVHITFETGACKDPNKEIRVVYFDGFKSTVMASQVYNVTKEDAYASSCNVVFLADCPAHSTVTYYVYYNNRQAEAPVYDGLRIHTEEARDTYNVTTLVAGVEKKYFRLFWKHLVDLYSDGERVCWPGGPPGWEFSQIVLASLWADGDNNPWFSGGDILTVVNSGPLFVDFNITQRFASDLWGQVINQNISTTYLVRAYYQPDLNPLMSYHMSLKFKQKDTVKNPVVVDFKLANSTSYEIYQDFTWKNLDQEVTTVSAKNDMPQIDTIWSATNPYGWFSYNGSIPGMPDKPAANIGLIPTYAGGTSPSVNYVVNFTAAYPDTPQEPYYDHHCTTQLSATTSGVKGDVIESKGFIKTYELEENAEKIMSDMATKLRNPLEYNVGSPARAPMVKKNDFAVRPYQDIANLSASSDGTTITLNITLNGPIPEVGWEHLNIYAAFDTADGGNVWFPDDIDVKYPEGYEYAWEYCLKIYNTTDIHLFDAGSSDLGVSDIMVSVSADGRVIHIAVPLNSIGTPTTVSVGIITTEDEGLMKDGLGPGAMEIVDRRQVVAVSAEMTDFSTTAGSSIFVFDTKPAGFGIGKPCWDVLQSWYGLDDTNLIVYVTFANLTGVEWNKWRLSIAIDTDHMTESGQQLIPRFSDTIIDPVANITYWEYCCVVENLTDIHLFSGTWHDLGTSGTKISRFGDLIIIEIPLSNLPGLVTPALTIVSGSDYGDSFYNVAGTYTYGYSETAPGAYLVATYPEMMVVDSTSPTIWGIVPAMEGEEIVEGSEVNVKANVIDNIGGSGIDKAFLNYSTDGGNTWSGVNMTKVGETDVYNGTIPGFESGTKVWYMIVATDKTGNEAMSPTYWYKMRIASRTGMWFGLGIGVGFTTAIIIAAAAFYIRRKPQSSIFDKNLK